jgi:DNA-binding XRE family transcriptional regulator
MFDKNIPVVHISSMNALKTYLRTNEIKQADFACSIGQTQSTVSRLCNGTYSPSLSLAFAIERTTGGAVPVKTWDMQDSAA